MSGSLYLPSGRKALGASVFHGASSPLRDSPRYAHLKQMLPSRGVAAFAYGQRGLLAGWLTKLAWLRLDRVRDRDRAGGALRCGFPHPRLRRDLSRERERR